MSDADPFREGGPLEAAWFLLKELDLPMPPIPTPFLAALEQRADAVFTSHPSVPDLQGFAGLASRAAVSRAGPVLAFGLDGHGVSAWTFRYAAVLLDRAVFVERPLPGPYHEADAALAAIRQSLRTAAQLLAAPNGTVTEDIGSRRRWCTPGAAWIETSDPLGAALAAAS